MIPDPHLTVPAPALDEEFERTKPKLVQREWEAQRADNAFLAKALPDGAYYTAIDVGRSKSAREGQLRKLRGVKPGIPDWLVVYAGITLWIERKAGASLSPNQKVTRDCLIANGHRWALARSTEEVEQACRNAGIPLRATLGEIRRRIAEQQARLAGPKRKRATKAHAAKPTQQSIRRVSKLRQSVMF